MPVPLRQLLRRLHHRTQGGAVEGLAESVSAEEAEALAEVRRTAAAISIERLRLPLEAAEMFALRQTVVGMESLRLLGEQLSVQGAALRADPLLQEASPGASPQREAVLASLFDDTVAQLPALCGQIYRGVARGMVDLEPVVAAIRNRSWSPKEVGTDHSPYVDQLLTHVQQLQSSLEGIGVPPAVQLQLMREVVAYVCEQMVDGYSLIKKISNEGRAMMTIDVQTLQAGLRRLLAPGQPLPMEFAFTYIKAFYLGAEDILEWSRAHPEYSVRHLSGLVALTGVNTQAKKKIISALETR